MLTCKTNFKSSKLPQPNAPGKLCSDVTSSWPCLPLSAVPAAIMRWDDRLNKELCMSPGSQTLRDIGRLCWAQPIQHVPPQTWACLAAGTRSRPSDVCQLSCSVPAEYTPPRHYQHPCPHLVYLGTLWVWWEEGGGKTAHCKRQVKCQTAYLYILISNNEAEYLPRIWCQWVLCRVDWAALLLFAFYLHENCTNRIGERIIKLLEAKTPKRGWHLWIKKNK